MNPPVSRKRMNADARALQILHTAIQFFSEHGLDGQMRVLADEIGITHTLLYHYFPTKQALIERVYQELFEGRWRPEWEALLDNSTISAEEKFIRFYCDYADTVLSREFVRIFVFSGLTDYFITDRFFALLRERLFPRLIRETRKVRGITSRAKPSNAEFELLMGLHGGIFYSSVRRWIYGQETPATASADGHAIIGDRVRSYLFSAAAVLHHDDLSCKRVALASIGKPARTSISKRK
jgi:AcrR family transcriptional regulator